MPQMPMLRKISFSTKFAHLEHFQSCSRCVIFMETQFSPKTFKIAFTSLLHDPHVVQKEVSPHKPDF